MDNIETKIQEEWKILPRYTQFEVSNLGNIRNFGNKRLRIPSNNGNGYKRITIVIDKVHKTLYIHRAVMEAFCPIENSDNFEPNHKDFNRSNNKLSNLEWKTHKRNMQISFENNQFKNRDIKRSREFKELGDSGKHHWSKLNKEQILEIYNLWITKKYTYESLGRKYNITGGAIKQAILRYQNGRYN